MKKSIMILIAAVIILAAFGGCGRNNEVIALSNGVYVNSTYNSEEMKDISGNAFFLVNNSLAYAPENLGFGFMYTTEMARINSQGKMCAIVTQPYAVSFIYATQKSEALYSENSDVEAMSEEEAAEFWDKLQQTSFAYAGLFRCSDGDAAAEAAYIAWSGAFNYIEEICQYDDDKYFFGYNTDYTLELTAEEQLDLLKLIAERDTFKSGVCIFKRNAPADTPIEFKAQTMDGKTVTENIFKDYKLTMVNIWATYCGACIEEMPELQELYEKLPEGVNMITVAVDGADNPQLAKEIYDDAKGTFMVVFPDVGLEDTLLNAYNAVPTTVFVDKNGNIVGNAQIGAPGAAGKGQLVDAYLKLINDRLKSVQ